MIIERSFRELDNKNNTSQYKDIYNFLFEIFIYKYRKDNNISKDKVISVFKAFKELGAKTIDKDFNITLEFFKNIRNDLTHDVTDLKIKILDAKKTQEEFEIFLKQYEILLGNEDYAKELDELLMPMNELLNRQEILKEPKDTNTTNNLNWI